MRRPGHPRSDRRRRLAGWLVPLYVLVFTSTSLHLAVADHHAGPHGAGHACGQADHTHHHPAGAASLAAEAPGNHCCHHLHDALPGKTLQRTLDALKHAAWRRTPEAPTAVAMVPPCPPRRVPAPDVPAEVRSGVTTVAAGRAPPVGLPA